MQNHGFQRIVLATDGSVQAEAAVGVAATFALASKAAVRVVHVWNLEVHHRHGVWDVEMRSEAERLIGDTVKRLRACGVEADGEIVRADSSHVAAAVAEVARQFKTELLVVGSRGLSDWRSMIGQSVSHQLLTAVDCPLLIVKEASSAASHVAQKVLLAVAGGEDVEPAARAAIAAATAPGSEVLVLHIAQALIGAMGFAYVEQDDEIRTTLSRTRAMLSAAGIPSEESIAEPGPVARTVADTAARWNADVIVIGSSRLSDVGSLLMGSVTHGLLRVSDRPVLVAAKSK
jgi:nucleotide-binding universal stress UspA family protein